MPNLAALSNEVKGLPDQAIQSELSNPTGLVPSYLLLAEAQRRELTRQAQQKQQAQGDSSTVYQDVVRNMMARQPPQGLPAPPAGMVPIQNAQPSGLGSTPGATPPQNFNAPKPAGMAKGGALRFAGGGGGWDPYSTTFEDAEQQYGLPPGLLRSMAGVESNYDPKAVSPKGAQGLMQIMPATAKFLGVDPMNPGQSIYAAGQYLANMRDKMFGGDLNRAIMGYNAGPTRVSRGDIPRETHDYLAKVLQGVSAAPKPTEKPAATAAPPAPAAAPASEEELPPEMTTGEFPASAANAAPAQEPEPDTEGAETAASHRLGERLQDVAGTQAPAQTTDPYANSRAQLAELIRQGDIGKATIRQLQSQVLGRAQNTDPWTYIGNIGAGMADYLQRNPFGGTALAFAHGAGVASQYRDQEQRQALVNYLALEKEGQNLDQQLYNLQTQNVALQGAQIKVTPDVLKLLPGVNPATSQPWQVGDTVYGQQALDLQKLLQQVGVHQAEQKPVTQTAQIALVGKSLNLPDDQSQWTNEDWKKVNEQINPGGQLTPSDIDQVARNYMNGIPIPPLGRGKYAIRDYEAVVHRVAELQVEEGDNLVARRGNISSDTAALKLLKTRAAALNTFEGTAGANLDMMIDWAKKLKDTGSPLLNKPLRSIDVNALGSEDVAAFNAALQVSTTEAARVLNNPNLQGALSDSGREEVRSLIPGNATLGQILTTAGVLRKDMANRKLYFDKEIEATQNRLENYGRPKGQQAPSPSGGAPGKRYQMNGREIVNQGGKWVYKDTGESVQ